MGVSVLDYMVEVAVELDLALGEADVVAELARELTLEDLAEALGAQRDPWIRRNRTALEGALRVIQHAHSPVLLARPGPERGPVLVASDLSDPAFPAISAGSLLASAIGEELTVLHVAEVPSVPLPSPEGAGLGISYALSAQDLQLLQEAARERLNSAMMRLGAQGRWLVEQGLPSVHVVSAARRLGARLLVIGTEGRTGLRRILLGSTAEQILRDAPCPVMVVRLHSQGGHS